MGRNNVLQTIHDVFCDRPLKTQEMCTKAVCIDPYSIEFIADHFKTQEMCNEAVRRKPYTLRYVPDDLRTQEMYKEAVRITFPDEYNKTKGIYREAVSLITLRHMHKRFVDAN